MPLSPEEKKRLREEAMQILLNEGGSYREAIETAATFSALSNAPDIKLIVPIRFRKRYEDMKEELDAES